MKAMKRQLDKAESKPAPRRLGDYFRQSSQKGREGLPLLSVTIADGMVGRESLDRKMDSDLAAEDHLLVRPGDLAYNMMRMWQGALAIADREGLVSPAYVVARPTEAIDPKFAGYFLKSARMLHALWAHSYGLTDDRLRLYYKDFAMIRAEVPPLPEQRRIAEILSAWDAAIEQSERLIAAKERRKRALTQQLLTGRRRFREFDGHKWKPMRLGDIGQCIRGVSYRPEVDLVDSETAGSVMLLRSGNILGEAIRYSDLQYVRPDAVSCHQRLSVGDVVICMANGSRDLVGKAAPFLGGTGKEVTVGAFCAIFRCFSPQEYPLTSFLFQTNHYRSYIAVLLSGSSINNLRPGDIESLRISFPFSLAEQQKITALLNAADQEVLQLKVQLAALEKQKRGLMQVLLSGKVRVLGQEDTNEPR